MEGELSLNFLPHLRPCPSTHLVGLCEHYESLTTCSEQEILQIPVPRRQPMPDVHQRHHTGEPVLGGYVMPEFPAPLFLELSPDLGITEAR